MSKLFTGSIDLTKIDKNKLTEFTRKNGNKGKSLSLVIWLNDTPDDFGNTMQIQQMTGKDETKIYLGNAKEYKKGEAKKGEDDLPF